MNWRDKVLAMREGTNLGIESTPIAPSMVTPGFVGSVSAPPVYISKKFLVKKNFSRVQVAHLEPHLDPDRWCWPHSAAMNTLEIDAFTARLLRFIGKGLSIADGEGLAENLVIRDREHGDRHSCFECAHLAGSVGWRCGNWQKSGVAMRANDAQLPADFVNLLQRCQGFKDTLLPTKRPFGA